MNAGRQGLVALARVAVVIALMSVVAGMFVLLFVGSLETLVTSQADMMRSSSGPGLSNSGLLLLALEIGLPLGAIFLAVWAAGTGAMIRLLDDARPSGTQRLGAAMAQGFRRTPRIAVTGLAHVVATLLAFVLTPMIVPAALVALAVHAVLRRRGRDGRIPMRVMVTCAIPFGAFLAVLFRPALAVAYVAIEGLKTREAARRSWAATGQDPWVAGSALAVAFSLYFALHLGIDKLLEPYAGQSWLSPAQIVLQAVTFGFPVAVAAVLARMLAPGGVHREPPPTMRRPLWATATAASAVLAITMTGGVAFPAAATDEGAQPTPALTQEEGATAEVLGEGVEEGNEEPPYDGPSVADPTFQAELIVREGPVTVQGERMTLWVNPSSSDGSPFPRTFYVDYYVITEQGQELLGTNQYSSWYGASSWEIDQSQAAWASGHYTFGAQVRGGGADPGVGPWLTLGHDVALAHTATQVAVTGPASVVTQQPATFTATVTAEGATVQSGWVEFTTVGGNAVPSVWAAVDAAGVATGTFTSLDVRTSGVEATYWGSPPLAVSRGTAALEVLLIPVQVTLTQSVATSTAGEAVTFTVDVASEHAAQVYNSTISLYAGHPDHGGVLVAQDWGGQDGSVTLTTSSLPAGSLEVYAVYEEPHDLFARSISAPVAHGVGVAPASLLVTSDVPDLARGGMAIVTIDLVVPEGVAAPTDGSVTVDIDGQTGDFDVAATTFPTTMSVTMADQPIVVTAHYSGSATHEVPGPVELTIERRAASTTVELALTPGALPGTAHTFVATPRGELGTHPYTGIVRYRLGTGAWAEIAYGQDINEFVVPLEAGSHQVQAQYLSGDAGEFADSAVTTLPVDVAVAPTSVHVTIPPVVRLHEPVAVDATVSADGTFPDPLTGTVQVETSTGEVLGQALLDGSATTTMTIPGLALGTHSLVVRYLGSAQHGSASQPVTVDVGMWTPTVTLADPGPLVVGQPTQLRAMVSVPSGAPVTVERGQVTFALASGTVLGTASIGADGVTTLPYTFPAAMSGVMVSATYAGVTDAVAQGVAQRAMTVGAATTEIMLTLSPANPAPGQPVQVTATVSAVSPSTSAVAEGYVAFTSGPNLGWSLNLQPDANGKATTTITAPAPGQIYGIAASYVGTASFASTYATNAYLNPRQATTTVTVVPSIPHGFLGDTQYVTVTVVPEAGAQSPTMGSVSLASGATQLGSASLNGSNTVVMSFDPVPLGQGSHTLIATYGGTVTHAGSTSDAASLQLQGYESAVWLNTSPTPTAEYGEEVVFTATVDILGRDDVPTGWVTFDIGGTPHTVNLTPASNGYAQAQVMVDSLAVGTYSISAEYVATGGAFAGAASQPRDFEIYGRTASILAVVPSSRAGLPVSMTFQVNGTGNTAPLGTVQAHINGVPFGNPVAVTPIGIGSSQASLTIPGAQRPIGSHQVRIVFTPIDGIHSPATHTGTSTATANTPSVTVGSIANPNPRWGDTVTVPVSIGRDSADLAAQVPLPSGLPTVSLVTGETCTAAVPGQFHCIPQQGGPMQVRVSYPGDRYYGPVERIVTLGTAGPQESSLTVDLAPTQFYAGQQGTLAWSLTGPGVAPEISGLPVGSRCVGEQSGTCTFTVPATQGGVPLDLQVTYPGTASWTAASWTRKVTPTMCYQVPAYGLPAGAATVTILTAPNCGTGYLPGTEISVDVRLVPTQGATYDWSLAGFTGRDSVSGPGTYSFVVGEGRGQITRIEALLGMQMRCVTVTATTRSHTGGGVNLLGLDTQPNCPGSTQWQNSPRTSQQGVQEETLTGRFLIGTQIATRTHAAANTEFYGLRVNGGGFQPGGAVTTTLTADLKLVGTFGPFCAPVTTASSGPGALSLVSYGQRCQDPSRADHFVVGSPLVFEAVPDVAQLGMMWRLDGVVQERVLDLDAARRGERTGIMRYETTLHTAGIDANATFMPCVVVTVDPIYSRNAAGTVSASRQSNCPVGPEPAAGTYHYVPGTTVNFVGLPRSLSGMGAVARLIKWNAPVGTGVDYAEINSSVYFTAWEDVVLRPAFVADGVCGTLMATAATAGIEIFTELRDGAGMFCDQGTLASSQWTIGTTQGKVSQGLLAGRVRATAGNNPLLGWQVSGPGIGTFAVAEDSVEWYYAPSYSISRMQAYACQEVMPFVTLIDVAGQEHTAYLEESSLITITPRPNCPFNDKAWTVGTELTFEATGDERGFDFQRWEGVAGEGTDTVGQKYVVSAESPEVGVMAYYQLICYELTLTGKPHRVTRLPQPNCPGAPEPVRLDGGIHKEWYVGGTPVALLGEVPGGNVWQGWAGDVEKSGKEEVAVVVMDRDKTVSHRYRSKDTWEKAEDFFTEAGNQMAIGAKKLLALGAFGMSQGMGNVPPFDTVGMVFDGLKMAGEYLEDWGVPSDVTDYFAYPADTMEWVSSLYMCVAAWGLAGGEYSINLGDYTEPYEEMVLDVVKEGGGYVGDSGLVSGPGMGGYDPNKDPEDSLGDAGTISDLTGSDSTSGALGKLEVAINGYKLLTNPQGIGWDDSAADAWDMGNFEHRVGSCALAEAPDFMRDALAPDLTEEDWKYLEENYGF